MPDDRHKRNDLTKAQKLEILKKYDALLPCSQREAAAKLGIPQASLSRFLKIREELQNSSSLYENVSRKRKRGGKSINVEQSLLKWYTLARQQEIPVTRSILMEKSIEFAKLFGDNNFKPTDGWLSRWKKRNNLVSKKTSGDESILIPLSDQILCDSWFKNTVPNILNKFSPDNIYRCDIIVLNYKAIPLFLTNLKGSPLLDNGKPEDYFTVITTCNMKGTDKNCLFFIGKPKSKKCFQDKNLSAGYYFNKNGMITFDIFSKFLTELDSSFGNLNRKIILILEDSFKYLDSQKNNIELIFTPSNIKLLFQEISNSLKTLYRKDLKQMITNDGSVSVEIINSLSFLDATEMIKKAWAKLKISTIKTSFKKIGFVNSTACEIEDSVEEDEDETFKQWNLIDDVICVSPGGESSCNLNESENSDTGSSNDGFEVSDSIRDIKEGKNENYKDVMHKLPSFEEVLKAVSVLKKNLELRGGSPEEYNNLLKVEKDALRCLKSNITDET